MKNLLVPIDFSDATEHVLATAEEIARPFEARVWLIHCVRDYPVFAAMEEVPLTLPTPDMNLEVQFPQQHRHLLKLRDQLLKRGIPTSFLFAVGLPADEILYAVRPYRIDLIVMGSHGHGPFHELFVGSVTKEVIVRSIVPVLIAPAKRPASELPNAQHSEPASV